MVRRRFVFPLVACYLLVLTAGGAFHQHGHAECASHDVASASHHHHHSHACDHACDHESTSSEHSHDPGDHDSCSICRFLSQPPIAAPLIEVCESTSLATEVSTARPIRRAAATPSIWQIRGPPHVA